MQVQAMQGYFEGGAFYQQGRRTALPERKLVIVNVLDVPIDIGERQKSGETKKRLAAIDKFFAEIDASDEEIPEEFERIKFTREADL